jgi:hypothetical protein
VPRELFTVAAACGDCGMVAPSSGHPPNLVGWRARKWPRKIFAVFQTALAGLLLSMADPQIMTLVTVVIGAGFAVTILRSNRMRSLSVAAIFVVGYVLSAVAQNSTPKPGKPPTQVAPNLEPPWPVRPATQVAPNLKPPEPDNPAAQVAPNPESLSSEELDNAATQVLKQLENSTTQAIPDPSAPIRPKTR